MFIFPILSSGSVAQYPLVIRTTQSSEVIRFLDGTDQRFGTRAISLRRWDIRLDLLNESELAQLESFFVEQMGAYSAFDFPDPYSGTIVPNCRFGGDGLLTEYLAPDVTALSFSVIETHA